MASFFNKIFSGSKRSKFYLDSWEDPVPITEVSIPGNHRLKEEVKPVDKPSFYELVSNYFYMRARDYKWGSINSIERSYGGGVRISININPTYLFTQPLSNYGRLSIGEYRSKVSYISLHFNVEDFSVRSYHELTISRQVYLNSSYPFVSQNNELTLSEQSVKIDIPFRCNISVSDVRELDNKILSVLEEAKSCILHNFEKEIYKSKLEIAQKDFKSTITNELVTDNFQHVIDLVNDSSINMGDNVTLFIPVKQLQSNKEKISIDLNQKEIDIFYELMEGAARIRGEFDVQTNISFTSDGIYLKISPKFEIEIPNRTETRIEEEYFNRWENAQGGMSLAQVQPILIRNPYRDFNLE
jgi:hypothetical protein